MRALSRSVIFVGTVLLALSAGLAGADSTSPCLGARVRCRAGERFLEVAYELELNNPADTAADVVLLPSLDTLERVEGVRGDLVVNRAGDALRASVPSGWKGRLAVHVRQRITRPAGQTGFAARLPMPPAVWRTVEADLPGPRADLSAGPDAFVQPLGDAQGRSRFRIVPLGVGTLELQWTQRPPTRTAAYSFAQTHDLSESPPEFRDVVALQFGFDGPPPTSLSVQLPA